MPLSPSNEDRARETLNRLNEIHDLSLNMMGNGEIIAYAQARFLLSIAVVLTDIKEELKRIRSAIYNTPPR